MDRSNVAGHVDHRLAAPRSGRGEVWIVAVLVALATFIVGLAAISSLRPPSNDDTEARFLAHEVDLQRLVVMVLSDGRRLTTVREPVGLKELVAAGANGDSYRSLMAAIGVTDLLYFPRSGRITLPISAAGAGFAEMSQSYVYTGDGPSNLLPTVSTDSHIKGGWSVRREGTPTGLPAPY